MTKNTEKAIKATQDAMAKEGRSVASRHRPGYRLSTRLMTDAKARDELADAYGEYERDLCKRYKTTSPGPVDTPTAPTLDEEFDDTEDCYTKYDRELANRYKDE